VTDDLAIAGFMFREPNAVRPDDGAGSSASPTTQQVRFGGGMNRNIGENHDQMTFGIGLAFGDEIS
jgi:hypothetical protein